MHILQVTPRYFPNVGGVETVVQKISEALAKRGAKVTVYSVDLSPALLRQQIVNGVLVKRFDPLLGDPFYIPEPRFIANLRREKADVIHVHNAHTFPPFLVALSKHRKQRFLLQPYYHRFGQSHFRHSLLRLYGYGLNNVVFPSTDLVIANSAYEKRMLYKDFSSCRNVVLIPLGVDLDEIKSVRHNPEMPKRILYIGALRPYKNVDKILEGFAQLIKKGDSEYRLVIVGDGSERDYLVSLARQLGIAPFVEWKRGLSRQQLLREYVKASVFVLLSHLESFSLVVYEALVIGVPVVVLNFGALTELVDVGLAEGVNSFEAEEIAEALLRATGKAYTKISDKLNIFLDWKDYLNRVLRIYYRLSEMQ
jgi:glycosyltransferase involved in cell wall biosynthesis